MKIFEPDILRKAMAFSLIEVVMALGIVSVAFVALLGMLPVGLNTLTDSIDASVGSQICQAVVTQARQAKFSDLKTEFSGVDLKFDEQGKLTQSNAKKIYNVTVNVAYSDGLRPGVTPDTGKVYDMRTTVLAVLQVKVAKISHPLQVKEYAVYVANNGQ